jgi:hypothetical protein
MRLRMTTATTAGTTTIRVWCTAVAPTIIPSSLTVTASNLSCNNAQWGGQTPLNPAANGSTNRANVAEQATAVSTTDQSATAYAGAGRINGTVVAAANGASGAVVTAEINVSTLTLGSATSVVFILQESNGGTNFTDIWVSDPITATGIRSVPPIQCGGRRRWCCHSVGGTSTTVTATITTLELPSGYENYRQFRDAYAASNALATVINSTTQTASTFGAATSLTATTQATSWFPIERCKVVTGVMVLGGGPTVSVQPVVSLEFSNDLTNGVTIAGATMTAAGNGTYACTASSIAFRYARLRVTTAASYSAGSYTVSGVGITGIN